MAPWRRLLDRHDVVEGPVTKTATISRLYPIRAVARLTGLSVDTLRAWERRYQAVVPARGDRGRQYSDSDVGRLQRLDALVRRGHAIGTIAGATDAELARLATSTESLAQPAAAPAPVADLSGLRSALDRYDLDEVEATLNRHAVVLPPQDLVFAVILPLLQDLGRRWQAGSLRPAHEHLISASVRSILGGLLRATMRPNASPKIMFATPSGERHELGLLCAALLTAIAGYGVLYLGPDLPAGDIAHAAVTAGAQIVVLSLTTPDAVRPAELKMLAKSAGVELWVGGPEADSLLSLAGARGRRVTGLAELVPMLRRDAR